MKTIPILARQGAPATQLHVEIVAKSSLGKRPVIFILPGGPGASIPWYEPYRTLIDIADLVFHDPRGCGVSDKGDPKTYTFFNYVDDVEAIRKHLRFNKIIILGKSYGATCAVGYAQKYQQHIHKLILSCGPVCYGFKEFARRNVRRCGTEEQVMATEKMLVGNIGSEQEFENMWKIIRNLYTVKGGEEANASQKSLISFESWRTGATGFLQTFNLRDVLASIPVPTLTIAAEKDWIIDSKYVEAYARLLPNNQFVEIKNCGHSLEKDNPKDYFSAIRNFLREQP